MSEKETEVAAGESSETEAAPASFLDRAIAATSQTAPDTTKELLATLTQEALSGTVSWSKNLTKTIEEAIAGLDEKMSIQMSEIMHQPDFQKLEGSWRGLSKLVRNSELGKQLKIRMLDITREELLEQFEDAPAIDRSRFFNIVYQKEFGTAGGEPFGLLLGDYAFDHSEENVALLRYVASVAASAHAPFIAELDPKILGYSSFETLNEGRPVAAGFESPVYNSWNTFRDSDDSRYVALTMPKTLARMPYGAGNSPVKGFDYEEFQPSSDGKRRPSSIDDFVWSSGAYEMGLLINDAFTMSGWCTAIRGLENGGKVNNLPTYTYTSESGDLVQQCPVQVNLTDEREKELSDLGFLPLVHYKNANFGVFMGAQTLQRPKVYLDPAATANAAISARLPYIMASSRIAHYLKVMGRDQIGSAMDPGDVEKHLSNWISEYVNPNAVGNEARAKAPLREARITVEAQAGRPGCYSAVAYLRPWLQMEELTTSLRMVANIPGGGGG
ncbi:type VI secretion system contractile sheath large subunit [Endozoicomonas euniceicola]|uniref:Type VI secretion system contractile sheath large subunit n=1 Tax=Endozoicomonas euniceicola TaxID=1234143 RepID=A0ABY6GQ77_9GAMM|nr:type VI secretion system contractile sheath large subunit [Endozoicomonas euniceicola]UYM14850.1 type VI secretion system contractile sheath large subunit [Endozoicomonas euniceicola]